MSNPPNSRSEAKRLNPWAGMYVMRLPFKLGLVIGLLVLVISVVAGIIVALSSPAINSYDACVRAGNPVLLSYPSTCTTKEGKRFVGPGQVLPRP